MLSSLLICFLLTKCPHKHWLYQVKKNNPSLLQALLECKMQGLFVLQSRWPKVKGVHNLSDIHTLCLSPLTSRSQRSDGPHTSYSRWVRTYELWNLITFTSLEAGEAKDISSHHHPAISTFIFSTFSTQHDIKVIIVSTIMMMIIKQKHRHIYVRI